MKKALLLGLCLTVSICQANVTRPLSTTAAVFGTAAITATSWGAVKLLGEYAAEGTLSFPNAFSQKSLGTWPTLAASVVAVGAAWLGWKLLSSYTASGYAHAARDIMSGTTCCCPATLGFVQKAAGDVHVLTELVVNHFAACSPHRATTTLTELSNQLHMARDYFVIAQRGGNPVDPGMIESIDGYINAITVAQPMVNAKSHMRAAQDILAGKRLDSWYGMSLEQVYELVKQANGDAQTLSDLVVRHCVTYSDGYLKAVGALVELCEKLQLAVGYFEIAKKNPACIDIETIKRDQKIVGERLTVIQSSLLILKAHPMYLHQQQVAELQRLRAAQEEAASAARAAARAAQQAADDARWARFWGWDKKPTTVVIVKA